MADTLKREHLHMQNHCHEKEIKSSRPHDGA